MQPIAAWLNARPWHGVLGLAFTLLLPLSPVLSGLVMAHLVFSNELRAATVQGVAAAALLAALALVLGASVPQIVALAIATWLPVFVLAVLLKRCRSVTLMMQVTVVVAALGMLMFFAIVGNADDYWNGLLTDVIEILRENGRVEQADWLATSQSLIAPQMTIVVVFSIWSLATIAVLLGYAFFQTLPEKSALYGRFSELNFGRVIAIMMALTSVGAVLSGAVWLQNLAFVLFAIFWLQGFAIMHWMYAERRLPLFVLLVAYACALIPMINVLLVLPLAVLGYLDVWFNFRARSKARSA